MKKVLIISFLIIGLLAVGIHKMNHVKNVKTSAFFGVAWFPFSSDPMDYDYYAHHYAFTSVFGKLVSSEKNAEIVPMLAKSWKSSGDFKVWEFQFREGLYYSNGDKIEPIDYVNSLKRILYLKKKKNSKSGLLEFIIGFESFNAMNSEVEGIKLDGMKLKLQFVKPMPDLLEKISFGFYSLAHPSLYNHETGEWNHKVKLISSGTYEVVKWEKEKFELELQLRKEINYIDYAKRIEKIIFKDFYLAKTSKDINTIDFLIADKSSLMVDSNFEFVSSDNGLRIQYIKCPSWEDPNKDFSSIEIRKWFRSKFFRGMESKGYKTTNNFFPETLNQVKTVNTSEVIRPNFKTFDLITHTIFSNGKIQENEDQISINDILQAGLEELGKDSGANLIQDDKRYKEMDVLIKSTGVEFEDYMETVKFMFLSKEGIQLPDLNGKIIKELHKEKPDINFINQELWEQAIIWPIRHYSSGIWFNKNSNIDHSEINFNSPAIDFQFLKWN